jgi:O-antigen/teichoic acid export membrane protein
LALLFGPAYADAQAPMLILCVGYALGAMLGPSMVFMNMTGRERVVTRSIAAAFLANFVLGAVAIRYAGAAGAALGNVVAYFVWSGWLWREARRQAGVDTSLVPAVSALLMPRLRG